MIIIDSLQEKISFPSVPCCLTMGNFDGVHVGHQALFARGRALIGASGLLAVLTFSNHTAQLIAPSSAPSLIGNEEYKMLLLERAGVDLVMNLAFTPEMAALSYEQFLRRVKGFFPFTYLVFGKRTRFGKDQKGDEEQVKKLQKELGFAAEYLEKMVVLGQEVSSQRIRTLLAEGKLDEVSALLGRRYSLYLWLDGERSASLEGVATLPGGIYPVIAKSGGKEDKGLVKIDASAAVLTTDVAFSDSWVELIFC